MKLNKFLLLFLFFQINLCGNSQGLDKYGRITASMQTLNQSQRDLVVSPAAGMLIWCSNCGLSGELQVFNGLIWINTMGGTANNAFTAPILSTNTATAISATSASAGGTITSNGGSDVTVSGVCWSTTTGPTLSNNYTTDGTLIGNFSSTMIGTFTSNTTFYLRAYATNAIGTSYGNEVTFIYIPPAIGDSYQGGIVFYTSVDSFGTTHGLIASTADQSATTWDNRIAVAAAYTGGSYTDWRLPNQAELGLMYNKRSIIGGFRTGMADGYWPSDNGRPPADTYAIAFSFYDGSIGSYYKYYNQSIRAIRAF